MTLCIAAACQDRGRPRLVIGTDWKVASGIATAEIQDKLFWITDNIPVLIAGTISRAVELKDTYRQYFQTLALQIIPGNDLIDHIKRPSRSTSTSAQANISL